MMDIDRAYKDYLEIKEKKGKRPGEDLLNKYLRILSQNEKDYYEQQFIRFAKKRHIGSRILVLGTGPSILNMSKQTLDANITIGCNGIGSYYYPIYYVICDPFVYALHKDVFLGSPHYRILSAFTNGECDQYVYYKERNIIGLSDNELYCGSNTGFLMLSIAYLMGATEIFLLGFDGYQGKNMPFHCYPDQGIERKRVEYEWSGACTEIQVFQEAMRFACNKMQKEGKTLLLVGDSTYLGDIVPKISSSDFELLVSTDMRN